jgi:hypothetical protein
MRWPASLKRSRCSRGYWRWRSGDPTFHSVEPMVVTADRHSPARVTPDRPEAGVLSDARTQRTALGRVFPFIQELRRVLEAQTRGGGTTEVRTGAHRPICVLLQRSVKRRANVSLRPDSTRPGGWRGSRLAVRPGRIPCERRCRRESRRSSPATKHQPCSNGTTS